MLGRTYVIPLLFSTYVYFTSVKKYYVIVKDRCNGVSQILIVTEAIAEVAIKSVKHLLQRYL